MPCEPILIVDDNAANAKLLLFLLGPKGHDVRVAVDAEEALALLDDFRPRLILMDLQLPGMSGLELTRQLKSSPATRDICIVALTAYAMTGDEAKAREAGCDGYVTKPIDTRAFPETIARFLGDGIPMKATTILPVEDNPITRAGARPGPPTP